MLDAGNIRLLTVSTRSHLPLVGVLAESLRAHHPQHRLTCYLVESDATEADTLQNRFDVVPIGKLPLPDPNRTFFQYTAFELCCAMKPWGILDQLLQPGTEAVVYLDADQFVCHPFLDTIAGDLQKHGVLLTLHFLHPHRQVDYLYFLRAGAYNTGFIAARNDPGAADMLTWWRDRLQTDCFLDFAGGQFADQRWMDVAGAAFDVAGPLRRRGINVGHWNLHECDFRKDRNRIMVGDEDPLAVFHFSQFQNPGLTRHETLTADITPLVQELADVYEKASARMTRICGTPKEYSFSRFEDGNEITLAMREAVRRGIASPQNPFCAREEILAAMPTDDPESVLDARIDYRIGRMREQARVFEVKAATTEALLARERTQMQRLRNHPVVGRVLRFWNRFVNKDL